jgi:hypothetical protein
VKNLDQEQKINVANYIFLSLALCCKLATSIILLLEAMGFIRVFKQSLLLSRSLYKTSFVFLLVACSLQLFKWINMIVRVQFFGGNLTRESYDKRVTASRLSYIVLATVAPVTNLVMIIIEAAS